MGDGGQKGDQIRIYRQTQEQKVCCKVSVILGQYLLSCLIGLQAVVQAWKCLEVAVKLSIRTKNDVSRPGWASSMCW